MIAAPLRLCRMPFVIRADDNGRISWVSPPDERGFPGLSDRTRATVFPTYEEAQRVIDRLIKPFGRIGVRLTIEKADDA